MFEEARAQMKCKLASVAYTEHDDIPSVRISILNHHIMALLSLHFSAQRVSATRSAREAKHIIFSPPSIIWQQLIKYRISRGGVFLSNALPRTARRRSSPFDNKSINNSNSLPPRQVTHRNNKLFGSFRQHRLFK
jgi:hypothetical protein